MYNNELELEELTEQKLELDREIDETVDDEIRQEKIRMRSIVLNRIHRLNGRLQRD